MATLVRVGDKIINIDNVTDISLNYKNLGEVRVWFSVTQGPFTHHVSFTGREADELREWFIRNSTAVSSVIDVTPRDQPAPYRPPNWLEQDDSISPDRGTP
jgi:hypothetical protein